LLRASGDLDVRVGRELEGGLVHLAEVVRYTGDSGEVTLGGEQVVADLLPQPGTLQVAHEVAVDLEELPRARGPREDLRELRVEAGRCPGDETDRRRRGDGHERGVAHAARDLR